MTTYPIVFGFRDVIRGRGFFAGIVADGRALLTQEDDGFWFFGVNPGGIAGGGKERSAAWREFKKSYLSVLFDVAQEADSFDVFKTEVERFFNEVNEPNERDWQAAHAMVKSGSLTTDLPRVEADKRPCRIEVVQLQQDSTEPQDVNQFDEDFAEAA